MCSAGSSAVGGYGGGVYLDGYGTYWSVACGHDWDGTTFYDPGGVNGSPVGYEYTSWRASWSWVAVLTCADLSAPPPEAYTTASGDVRPGLAALPSPMLEPLMQQLRQRKALAGVSKFARTLTFLDLFRC
jgi:hypothetical protein